MNNESFRTIWKQIKKQVIKDYDAIFGVSYKLWAINTSHDAKLYLWQNWKEIFPLVNSIVQISNTEPSLRTYQSFEHENKWLGFGRMKWNESNNIKWTTKYRSDEYNNQKLKFFNTEVWSPDWNHCIKKGVHPEIFVNIYHYPNNKKIHEGILIAVQNRIAEANEDIINSNIEAINRHILESNIYSLNRYWYPSKGFKNRIEDMNNEVEKLIDEKHKENRAR